MCLKKLRDHVKLLFTLSWMSFIIYSLLIRLQDVQMVNSGMARVERNEYQVLLHQLGFIDEPKLYPQAYHYIEEKEWPVFAMALHSEDMHQLIDFLMAFRKYFLDHRLVIFAINLSKKDKQLAMERCYCQVRDVPWPLYPRHVQDLKLQGYLTLLIQETLQEFGSVFWCDVMMRFTNATIKPHLSTRAMSSGVLVWPRASLPTSAFTHPKLYKHFHTNQSLYFFQQMVWPVPGFYVNTETLHYKVMKPWVNCVLNEQCLSPKGAQYSGCKSDNKPRYKYTGCHRYARSAFNIVLRQAFKDEKSYKVKQDLFKMTPERSSSMADVFKNLTRSVIF